MLAVQSTTREMLPLEGRVPAWTQRQKPYAQFILAKPREVTVCFILRHKFVLEGSLYATAGTSLTVHEPKNYFWYHDIHKAGAVTTPSEVSLGRAPIIEIPMVIVSHQSAGTNGTACALIAQGKISTGIHCQTRINPPT